MSQTEKFLIVGHGGRESAFASSLSADSQVFALAGHRNPSIESCCEKSGGRLQIGDVEDPAAIASFASENGIDYAFVNADGPLSKGAIDALMEADVRTIGPSRDGARIEWDKVFSMKIVDELFPAHCPRHELVSSADQAARAVEAICEGGGAAVIKPRGLTGGKGVKVMGEHLADIEAAVAYVKELLESGTSPEVLVVERLEGIEFTIMGLTDGRRVVGTPVSYDYPYRLDGNRGAGTGGMGCFTDQNQPPFFLEPGDYNACLDILGGVVERLGEMGAHFNGVLNGGFFITAKGLYFMEFNARFGDPEGINILSLLKSPFSELLRTIHHGGIESSPPGLEQRASLVKYLVSPTYPGAGEAIKFRHDSALFAEHGIDTHFASSEATGDNHYRTVSSSRILALSTLSDTIEEAAVRVNRCVDAYADIQLQFRADIGLADNLQALRARAESILAQR